MEHKVLVKKWRLRLGTVMRVYIFQNIKVRQEDGGFKGSLSHTVRPCLKKYFSN